MLCTRGAAHIKKIVTAHIDPFLLARFCLLVLLAMEMKNILTRISYGVDKLGQTHNAVGNHMDVN